MSLIIPEEDARHPQAPTCAFFESHLWVSPLSPTTERLDSRSAEPRNPLQRFAGFSELGVPLGIDWSENPAPYELAVHWRGYVPRQALSSPEWDTSATHIVRSGRNGHAVAGNIVEWRESKITRLRKEVEELAFMLEFVSAGVPIPEVVDTLALSFIHPKQAGAFRAMAASRFYYLDLIGFYCWVRRVFDEAIQNRAWDEFYVSEEEWIKWRPIEVESVGYLVDFHTQWKVISGPIWLQHSVPFHYIWDEGLSTNERFRRWDPATLGAFNESTGDDYDSGDLPTTDSLHSGTCTYDSWGQKVNPLEDNVPRATFERGIEYYSPNVRFFIQDFESWLKRPLTGMTSGETAMMTSLYYFEDVQGEGSPYRIYFRWRERTANSYRQIESSILEPFRLSVMAVRETHKFRYAGYQDNPVAGRSLLSRIGDAPDSEDGSPVLGDMEGDVAERRSIYGPSDEELRLRRRREKARLRSASPPSLRVTNRSSPSFSPGRRERTGLHESLTESPRSPSPLGSDRSGIRALHSLSIGGRTLIESLLPSVSETYPPDLSFAPRWSRRWLSQAIIHFENPRAEWRMRAWHYLTPDMPLTALLTKAVSSHIPFCLEVPAAVLQKWRRPLQSYSVWEIEAGTYYTGVSQARPIIYTAIGSEYARDYELSVLEILNRPNSTAFFFEGGLLARLALHYGNPGLLSRAMEGPSAAMVLHGSGHTDFTRASIRERVTDPEKNVLLGQTGPGGPKTETCYIWPPVVIFQARFLAYDGRWTQECENWFVERAALIKGGFVDARTEGAWWNNFRHARRSSRITDGQWRNAEDEIVEKTGASWEGAKLSSLFRIADPRNDFRDP